MSQERWKYWIGEDGFARIREEDMPKPFTVKAELDSPRSIGFRQRMNPDYYEFKTEIYRVTGKTEVFMVQEGDPDYKNIE